MRWAAKRVGKGDAASIFQEVAQACVEETEAATGRKGTDMVTGSVMGSSMFRVRVQCVVHASHYIYWPSHL